jgi:hypothetical protein
LITHLLRALHKEISVKRHKRIEIKAFRRRVTVCTNETELNRMAQEPRMDEGVWLNDADSGDPIAFESEEGQIILADAVRSLERRLSPEARASIKSGASYTKPVNANHFHLKLYWLYQRTRCRVRRFTSKENSNV